MGPEERALQDALARVVPPALATLVLGPASGDAIDASGLLDPAMLARLLGSGAPDRRAVVSVWALEAFEAIVPRVVAAAVLLGRVPDGEVAWLIVDGRVVGLRAPAWKDGNFAAFAQQVLGAFVAIVAERGGVSPRVLWSNAGHIVEAFLGMLGREAGSSAGGEAIRELLARPFVDGGPNGLFAPVRYVDGQRFRRVCCLRFLARSWPICRICPVPQGHASRNRA